MQTTYRALMLTLLSALLLVAAHASPSSDLDIMSDLAFKDTLRNNLAAHEARYIAELTEFVSIPSVSAVPDHQPDILRAAEWVAAYLRRAGFNGVRLLPNPAGPRPAVFAERIVSKDLPTALLYGHYDVQPADPVDAWTSPPFEPVVRDGALFGRGASDDKGCLLGPLQALEAWMNATDGDLPVNFKIMIEGEEEIGSPFLEPFLEVYKDNLAADFVISADGSQISDTQPSITLGLRGAAALEVRVTALARDVHSGSYGGAVQNPARALAHLISSMFDPVTNKVLVKGFYDRVVPATDADRADMAAAAAGGEEDALPAEVGALGPVGEEGYRTLERVWLRPTLEVVGISGGYAGAGIKTVLPAEAVAKLAARLVPDQRPQEILALVAAHIEAHRPEGVNITTTPLGFKAAPFTTLREGPVTAAAARVLEAVVGAPPRYVRGGATIPALAAFQKYLGAETTVLAFGLPSDTVHAPDERYNLTQYAVSREAYVRMLAELEKEVAAGRLTKKTTSDRSEL